MLFLIALSNVLISLKLGDWFSSDEKILIVLLVFPFSGVVMLEKVMRTLIQSNISERVLLLLRLNAHESESRYFSGTTKILHFR
jgi:hypothetical protein